MGRKDASNQKAYLPIDNYRKQIGKENHKRGKKDMKELKRQAQSKSNAMGVKDLLLGTLCFVATTAGLYALLYFIIQPTDVSPEENV